MRKYLFAGALFVLFFVISGCSRAPVMTDRVLVKNATDWKVVDVRVLHKPTNRMGSVSAILPQKYLDIGFPEQPLLAQRAVVRWVDGQGQPRSDELDIPYDAAAAKEERPMSLIYILHSSGSVSAEIQDSMQLDQGL